MILRPNLNPKSRGSGQRRERSQDFSEKSKWEENMTLLSTWISLDQHTHLILSKQMDNQIKKNILHTFSGAVKQSLSHVTVITFGNYNELETPFPIRFPDMLLQFNAHFFPSSQ